MRCMPWLVLLLGACGQYNYNRAALVPRATPRLDSGQPLTGRGQLDVGASSVMSLGKPTVGDDPNAGVEIPGTQLRGGLRAKVGEGFSFGFLYEAGLDAGAQAPRSTQPPVENGNVTGYGMTMDYSFATGNPRLRIGIGVEAILWSVPYVEYYTCAAGETCFPYAVQTAGRDLVETGAVSVTPSYRASDELSLFGGLTMRHHPTIQQKGTSSGPVFGDDAEVTSGPANLVVSAGAQLSFADGAVLASAIAYWDTTPDPVRYKPGLALMLSVPLGRPDRATPPLV
ncbi:MAG: hypothetical protein M3680_21120, partial [Myxococcota bacterium]|nr:hypothetical protein [Myxococcota bacterium]